MQMDISSAQGLKALTGTRTGIYRSDVRNMIADQGPVRHAYWWPVFPPRCGMPTGGRLQLCVRGHLGREFCMQNLTSSAVT